MSENNLQGLMGISLEKIREMVDVNTVVGEAIITPDGMTLIPISKVSYGFAAGGSDLPTKGTNSLFGGGSGAGINITPVAFLAAGKGEVEVIPIVSKPDSGDKMINMVPEVIDKIVSLFSKKKEVTNVVTKTESDDEVTVTETTVETKE